LLTFRLKKSELSLSAEDEEADGASATSVWLSAHEDSSESSSEEAADSCSAECEGDGGEATSSVSRATSPSASAMVARKAVR
jgi:hypothetical protein